MVLASRRGRRGGLEMNRGGPQSLMWCRACRLSHAHVRRLEPRLRQLSCDSPAMTPCVVPGPRQASWYRDVACHRPPGATMLPAPDSWCLVPRHAARETGRCPSLFPNLSNLFLPCYSRTRKEICTKLSSPAPRFFGAQGARQTIVVDA